MGYYTYPIDTKTLIRKKRSIKNELLQRDISWIEKRIAVLGGSTTNEVVDQLELALLEYGIKAEFYQSEYGLYWEDAMFGNEVLDGFGPDIVYIHTSWRNIKEFPQMVSSSDEVADMLEIEFGRFAEMWPSIEGKFKCPIIQNNFDRPNYRLMGNRDIWDYRGRSNYISRLNQMMYEYAQSHASFYVNDIDYIAQDFGLKEWSSQLYWNMYKYACCIDAIPYVAGSVARIIKSLYGKNKKLLALDLDNTLWGGIVGDDGVEGIKIGQENPQGQVYFDFQEYCKNLKQIGAVLAINSKNDEKNALEGINHPAGALKENDFVSIKANWNTKDQNLREIAEELSLGVDSFVLVDDNPVERDIVRTQLPSVETPDIGKPEDYISILDHQGYFETTIISTEDLNKTEQYKVRAKAKAEQESFTDYNEYLGSLGMKAQVMGFDPVYVQRVSQLTNKTNQFNLTTLRCSEDDIRNMQSDKDYICLCARLEDKFADNGIVTVISAKEEEKKLYIKLWLMSCRVLKRGLEDFMMNSLVDEAKRRGVQQIVGEYRPTQKNGMVKDFFSERGFSLLGEDSEGNTRWILDVSDFKQLDTRIVAI